MFGNNKHRLCAPVGVALGATAGTAAATTLGISAVTGAISLVSTIQQAGAAKDQARAQRSAQEAQQRSSEFQAQRERIRAVREARIQRATMETGAGAAGVGMGSSGVVGAASSMASQLGANIGAQNVQRGFAQIASQANQAAANAAAKGAQWQAIGGLSNQLLTSQGGWAAIFKNINKSASAK